MAIIDIPTFRLDAPVDTPKGFAVTPGEADISDGADSRERPSWASTFGAAFRQDNTVGASSTATDRSLAPEWDYQFRPWKLIEGTAYEPHWSRFTDARNRSHFDAIRAQIDRETDDRKLLDSAPWWQSVPSQVIAGTLDLPTLLPGGAFYKSAKGGFSIGKSALSVGAAAGASSLVQETALQNIQETRSLTESAINVGASVFLGGLLGAGGAGLLTRAEWGKAVAAVEGDLAKLNAEFGLPPGVAISETVPSGTGRDLVTGAFVGQDAVKTLKVGDRVVAQADLILPEPGADQVIKIQKIYTEPDMRRQGYARMLVDDIFREFPDARLRTSIQTKDGTAFFEGVYGGQTLEVPRPSAGGSGAPSSLGAAANMPADVEANAIAGRAASAVAAATAKLNPVLRILQSPSPAVREIGTNLFENSLYLKKNFDGVASEPAVETLMKEWNGGLVRAIRSTNDVYGEYRKAGGGLSHDEFRNRVGMAMRRGDEDEIPEVAKVAKAWRQSVFDPLKEAAIKSGLLPKDVSVETAMSYFSRMWNRNKLLAEEPEFKATVREWVMQNAPKWAEQYDKGVERRLDPLRRELDELEMAKLRRGEEAKLRGEEVETGEFSESDIRQAIRLVQGGGGPRPNVKTLTQFIQAEGGLVDFGGELARMGITNKSRPGFVRKERKRAQSDGGGWSIDDMARHAWENGYFPDHIEERPTVAEFLEALSDDFSKRRAVVRHGDRDAYRLQELIEQIDQDLHRIGVDVQAGARFATSDEVKGMVARVYKAMDAEADKKVAALKKALVEREAEARVERDAAFVGDPRELSRSIADEVFDRLTGRIENASGRPEFITVKARGPLKERTFNIPDAMVERWLENDVDLVGRRYTRIMGADVELSSKFGGVDMADAMQRVRDNYAQLRAATSDPKELTRLGKAERNDVRDLEALRDLLRHGSVYNHPVERSYDKITRSFNHVNYIRVMGEVVLASFTEVVRPAMVHGLSAYMGHLGQLATNLKAVKMSVEEAQRAGNIAERVLGHRLATFSEIIDPYAHRGPVEALLQNLTNVASKWNGIRVWTDAMKSIASVITQDRIIKGVTGFDTIKPMEKAYLAYLGIDESMAGRIAGQFKKHGEVLDKVHVAHTEAWTDDVAVRSYRAAMNKDVDSIIVMKGVADVPLFASTPTGRALLQFKSFALASHQRILLRGLQEDQARFVGGLTAMTLVGMFAAWAKSVTGNRPERFENVSDKMGWWVAEGLDRSGVLSVPMEIANAAEKLSGGFNPIKTPIKAFDTAGSISQKNQNRNKVGSFLGPTAGLADDVLTIGVVPKKLMQGEELSKGEQRALKSVIPFNSYSGVRQMLEYIVAPPQQ